MRKKMFAAALAGLGIAASMGSAPALAGDGNLALGVSAGTLGIGPELSWRFNDHLGLRASAGSYDYSRSEDLDDIEYDGDLKLSSSGVMLDVYPFGGGFRLSAGARINHNKIDLAGTPTGNVEIGDNTYTPTEVGTLTGQVIFDQFSPTFTLGYGGKLAKGLTFTFETGVMIQGAPRVNYLMSNGTLANNPAFVTQLALERQRAEEDADDFKMWPIIQLGLAYRF